MFRIKSLFFFGFFIFQIFFFWERLFPNSLETIEMRIMRCTCPDARILNGENHLKQITPDSLKQYHFNYSEIYLAGEIPKFTDPFSHGVITIKGEVIGKERAYKNAPWNPLFRIENWDHFTQQKHYLLITFLSLQLLIYIVFLYKKLK